MINEITIFYGSKKDFEKYLVKEIDPNENTIPFMELIQHYNARLRPNESGVGEDALYENIDVDNCIVRADDYGSVLAHVISNFINIVGLNHDINRLYVHNPPRRVKESIESYSLATINYQNSKYPELSQETLKEVYSGLNERVLGQQSCKEQIISGLYRLMKQSNTKPVVLMLYGMSGVGKTESAKSISSSLGGELLRIQFSMMQTDEAFNYIFGSEHSKSSFARDMMGREANVILIDEFDKVNPTFYNAFYELFDEGKFSDTNYDVDLGQAIFLLTSNFADEDEIQKYLGPAMFSRIGCCIKYEDLLIEQKQKIIEGWYDEIFSRLDVREQKCIEESNIEQWFLDNADRYDNIRILKAKLENAIFDKLAMEFIISNDK
jgi:ATPases with chaperone activity, ATP-binding subunit